MRDTGGLAAFGHVTSGPGQDQGQPSYGAMRLAAHCAEVALSSLLPLRERVAPNEVRRRVRG